MTAPPATDQWMLRSPDGREYGPVSFEGLRAWAAQNRFTAGYAVSGNRQDWRPVESVPELGMDWYVEPGDGNRYGPFHPLALLDYVREGAIPPETKVVHKVNRGEAKAYQVLLEAFVDAIDQTAEVQGELITQVQALQERLEERDRWFAAETKALQEERERRQEAEIALRRVEEQGAPSAEMQARVARLEADLAKARQETEFERRLHRETREAMAGELRALRAESGRRIAELEAKASAHQSAVEADRRELERVDRQRVEAESRLRQSAAAEARLRDELAALQATRQEDEEALRQDLRQARDEAARVRKEEEAKLQAALTQASEHAAAASRAEAELAAVQGRADRLRQATEQEQADLKVKAALEARGEADRLAMALEKSRADLETAQKAYEQERQARLREKEDILSREEADKQRREAAEALTREVTGLRREKAALQQRIEAAKGEVDEAARTEQELVHLRQSAMALKKRLDEAEAQAAAVRAEAAALREQEAKTARERSAQATQWQTETRALEVERERQADRAAELAARLERAEQKVAQLQEQAQNEARDAAAAAREVEAARDRIRLLEDRLAERPRAESPRSAWTGPIVDVPAEPAGDAAEATPSAAPPPKRSANLAGLEAQAQAELRAWREKQAGSNKNEPPESNRRRWIPWK